MSFLEDSGIEGRSGSLGGGGGEDFPLGTIGSGSSSERGTGLPLESTITSSSGTGGAAAHINAVENAQISKKTRTIPSTPGQIMQVPCDERGGERTGVLSYSTSVRVSG